MTSTANPATPPTEPDEVAALCAAGRFAQAARLARLRGGVDDALDAALAHLSDVEVAIRDRRPRTARAKFAAAERTPEDLLAWDDLAHDVAAVCDAQEAIDRLEMPEARTALEGLRGGFFTAERDALLGTIALREGANDVAIAHLEAALAVDANHVRALTNRGSIRLEGGDLPGAIADYERAIAIDPNFANAHHNLGVAYRRQGQIGKSVAALRKAQRLATQRDAEDLRAPRGARGAGAGGGIPWRRYATIAAVVAIAWWFFQGRGTP